MTFGLEFTLVPDLPGKIKAFKDEKFAIIAADKLCKRINKIPEFSNGIFEFTGAIEIAPAIHPIGYINYYCLEIRNGNFPFNFDEEFFNNLSYYIKSLNGFIKSFDLLIKEAAKLKLYPRIIKKRNNKIIYYPTGGGHIHVGANLFYNNESFYKKMDIFQKNLYLDMANRPYIKWLFSEWFDNHNSSIFIDRFLLERMVKKNNPNKAYSYFFHRHCIINRIQYCGKPILPTYEFRFFDAVRTGKQLFENIEFLYKWINYHVQKVEKNEKTVEFNLNLNKFHQFKNLKFAWSEISKFLRLIGIKNVKPYKLRFDENYKLRMKYGKMA